jgi:CDP-archaeol synthase
MHPLLILKLTFLLSIANGTPVLAKKLCGDRLSQPIDGGIRFFDRRRLFGPTKTVRGALTSVVLATVVAPALGLEIMIGVLVGSMAMVGDLLSSFMKRRLNFAPSSRATGLDQIPESMLPLLACRDLLGLSALDIIVGIAVFTIGAILLSLVFYHVGIRDRPF